ncbi:unnamed protein product [Amoebophrya sp. A120]|nr:unnamed protein product [Amoebophrya sp. A120]|eukprot:GSA120T00023545001.1
MENPFEQKGGADPWFQGANAGATPSFPSHPMAAGSMTAQAQMMGVTDAPGGDGELDVENEPPILEELGIDIDAVFQRIKAVALLRPLPQSVVLEGDLTGPLLILGALMLGFLLQGKVQFELLYLLASLSSFTSYLLINLMAQKGGIDLYCVISMFGYGLLPVVILSFIAVIISLKSYAVVGTVCALITVFWCTATSSKFVESAMDTHDQHWLIAYPTGLLYSLFVVVTIF